MQLKKIVIASIFFGLLTTLALVFRPVPNASPENTLRAFGTVEQVFEAGDDGVLLKLKDDDRMYYINQGLQREPAFRSLQSELPGQQVEIYYVKYWTPIDPLSKLKHIAKVDLNRITLYSSIK